MPSILGPTGTKKVILRPGDRVEVGYVNACRFVEKTVASVNTETNTITFDDGTTYNAKANPEVQLIIPSS